MKNRIFIIAMIFCFFSCNKQQNYKDILEVSNIEYTNQIKVTYEEISSDYLFSYPKSLLLTDSCFIIQDDKGHKFYYHVLNRWSGLLEFEFAEKGQGPEEILSTSINPIVNREKIRSYFLI